MGLSRSVVRILGVVLGMVLLAAGVMGAVFLSRPQPQPPARLPVRPVKTMLVGGPVPVTVRRYPGKVQAAVRVQLSFDVAGTMDELLVTNGQKVKKGDVLAKLDPRDFQNNVNAKKAIEDNAKVNMERDKQLLDKKVISQAEFDLSQTAYEVAKSNSAVAQKALEDTVLRATFDGVVAYTIAKQHQSVAAKEPILSLQDPSKLEIVINLPEQVVALTASRAKGRTIFASFDYVPDREFPVAVKEYATEADPATQTYAVTFSLTTPEGLTILPGMSATISVDMPPILSDKSEGFLLPVTAVPADGKGQFYVWLVEPVEGQKDLYSVRRQNVSVGPMTKEYVVVVQGVTAKDRVVTAGVHLLEDKQQVRLLTSPSEGSHGSSASPAPSTRGAATQAALTGAASAPSRTGT